MGFEISRNLQDVFWEYQNFRDFFFVKKKRTFELSNGGDV